jgi:uncharacterized protein (TIGR03382 family)
MKKLAIILLVVSIDASAMSKPDCHSGGTTVSPSIPCWNGDRPPTQVPLPGTLALMGLGMAALGIRRKLKR